MLAAMNVVFIFHLYIMGTVLGAGRGGGEGEAVQREYYKSEGLRGEGSGE